MARKVVNCCAHEIAIPILSIGLTDKFLAELINSVGVDQLVFGRVSFAKGVVKFPHRVRELCKNKIKLAL